MSASNRSLFTAIRSKRKQEGTATVGIFLLDLVQLSASYSEISERF
jgi:hypothetical protein